MGIYDSLCDGPSTVVQGGGDNAQGFTARSLSSRAVALRHANASCKTWRYGQPNQGEETFWPEPVVDLRDQGTGVLRALALVEKMGGSLTFVLKVVAILRRKRRKVSCCVLVPFACCINPRGCSLRPETLVPPLGGGRLDPHALAYLAVYLVVPTVCLFKANCSGGASHGPRYLIEGIHELDYFARGRNKVGGAN